MRNLLTNKGMTLLEIILALTIFGMLSLVFLTMFTTSFVWVAKAGDKGEAYNYAKQDVDTRIASKEAIYTNDLTLIFEGEDYQIRGGLVETEQTVGKAVSKVESFVPLVSTIRMNPIERAEGYEALSASIQGYETNFINGATKVEIYDGTGNNKIHTITPNVLDKTNASFNLPSGLLFDEYIIKVATPVTGKPYEVSRAKLTISQPAFVAVGNNSVYVSADGRNWTRRSDLAGFPSISNINSVTYNGQYYTAGGNFGSVLQSDKKRKWMSYSITGEDLFSIAWSAVYNKFYAVGAEGGIYFSSNGQNWLPGFSGVSSPLKDIVSTTLISGNTVLNIAGDDGVILTSTNGSSWSSTNIGTMSINAIASGMRGAYDIIIAAGNNGIISTSSNGVNWNTPIALVAENINDITYNQGRGLFIAVGDGGLILTSSDGGSNWSINSSGTTENLNGVFSQGDNFVAVGNNGTILYSHNGSNWSVQLTSIDDHLNAVAGRGDS